VSGPALPLPEEFPAPLPGRSRLPAWVVVGLATLAALNLRSTFGSVPPVLHDVAADLHLSGTTQGLLSSVVILFMGVSAPFGQKLSARIGGEKATVVALIVLAAGLALRLVAYSGAVFLLSSAIAGIGMGCASALLPGLIAHHVPRIRGFATGMYSTGLAVSVAAAAWLALPTQQWLGGWRPALGLWGGVTGLTAVLWFALLPRLRSGRPRRLAGNVVVDHRLPWRSRTAWWVTLFTGAFMVIGFSALAWVTPLYVELGVPVRTAAGYLAVFQIVQLVAMLSLPWATDFLHDRRPLLAGTVLCTVAGLAMLVLAPVPLAVPALCLFGIGVGGGATLALVLLGDTTRSQHDAARLNGMVMLVAYSAGAAGPAVLGVLHDLTGSFTLGYSVVLGLAVLVLVTVPALRPGRTIDDAAAPEPSRAAESPAA
jgi:CP family cyanate transporter-like MFS transporter